MMVPNFPGWGNRGATNPPLSYTHHLQCLSSEYWGYYLLHLQSRGAERAIKVSHCPEIIIRWCLRPGLEIMIVLVGPGGRRKGSEGMWDEYSCYMPPITGTGTACFVSWDVNLDQFWAEGGFPGTDTVLFHSFNPWQTSSRRKKAVVSWKDTGLGAKGALFQASVR